MLDQIGKPSLVVNKNRLRMVRGDLGEPPELQGLGNLFSSSAWKSVFAV